MLVGCIEHCRRWSYQEEDRIGDDDDDDDDDAAPARMVSIGMGMAWVARLAALTVGLSRSDHRLAHMGP